MSNFWQKLPRPFSVLAPMDDVTDNVFRKVIQEIARPHVFFTEFTNADGIVAAGNIVVKRKLKYEEAQRPIVAQIWGANPEAFFKAAKIIKNLGFDGIDINMGCPVHEVVKKCAGAGLIGKYELATQIVRAVKEGVGDLPVSVKTRLGISENIVSDWAEFLLQQDLAALTIHARTAKEMSKVPAHWEETAKVVTLRNRVSPTTLIIGNGDVKSSQEILIKADTYKVDGVMVGRGIFDNPWLFESGKVPHDRKKEEYINLLFKHFDYFEKENNDPALLKKRYPALKKFFKTYIKGFSGANVFRQELMETKTIEEAKAILKNVIASEAKQSDLV